MEQANEFKKKNGIITIIFHIVLIKSTLDGIAKYRSLGLQRGVTPHANNLTGFPFSDT